MKCPRNKFTELDYTGNITEQKKEICSLCEDNLEEKTWGEHCNACLTCLITGKKLSKEAFEKLPKETRMSVTHSLSDEGRKELNLRLSKLKKQSKRPLW